MKRQNLPRLVKAISGGPAPFSIKGLIDTPLMQKYNSENRDNDSVRSRRVGAPSVIRAALHHFYYKLYVPKPAPGYPGGLEQA
jgi:hypothetical protein